MWTTIKYYFHEWLKTLSFKNSFFSSKRIERFVFVSVSIMGVITCFIYEIIKGTLTATETTILISPLLIAAGYNLKKTEEAKVTAATINTNKDDEKKFD